MNIQLFGTAVVAVIAGIAVGWILRAKRSAAQQVTISSELQGTKLQCGQLTEQLRTLNDLHASLRDQHLRESTAHAASAATANRVPGLEAQVAELLKAQGLLRSEAMGLSRAEAEAYQQLKAAQEQLAALIPRSDLLEQKVQDLNTQLSQVQQRRATLESEASRIPAVQAKLEAAEQSVTRLSGELSKLNGEYGEARAELTSARDQLSRARVELNAAQEQLEALQANVTRLSVERMDLSARLEAEKSQSDEKMQLLNEAKQALSDSFKAMSTDALRNNNQSFLDLAKATLEKFQDGAKGDLESRQKAMVQLVQPIKESLDKVDIKLGELENERVASYSSLNEQLRGLVETHLPGLRSETEKLVKALRQPTVRGRWGELQLKRVVEMAGMLDHCDFLEQENRTTEDGKLRPDLIVKLPGGRNIIVDAKAPISAYLEATEAPDEITQRARIAQHAQQVRSHITALGRKAYWDQFTPTPEFVVMFIPGEAFFSAALQEDPSLIECGVGEKVIAATPTTLIALLRAVAYGWRQESLAANAEEVGRLGKELYERICTLGDKWSDVGDRLRKTVDAYNGATASLEARVIVSARRFKDLKVGADERQITDLKQVEVIPRSIQVEELLSTDVPSTLLPSANGALLGKPDVSAALS